MPRSFKVCLYIDDEDSNTAGDLEVNGFGSVRMAEEYLPVFTHALMIRHPKASISSEIAEVHADGTSTIPGTFKTDAASVLP